jgi:hypothetical protein
MNDFVPKRGSQPAFVNRCAPQNDFIHALRKEPAPEEFTSSASSF